MTRVRLRGGDPTQLPPLVEPKTHGPNGHTHVTMAHVEALTIDDLKRSGLKPSDMSVKPSLTDLHDHYAPGYLIGYPGRDTGRLTDRPRFRYLLRQADAAKYDQLPGPPAVYFSRRFSWREIRRDPTKDIFITEGEKKSECACKVGLPTLGLGGAYNFKPKGKEQLVADLEDFVWETRKTYLVFDSDCETNVQIRQALDRLATLLVERGAHPYIVRLPELRPGQKCGLDDFLVARRKIAFEALVTEAEEWQAARRILRTEPLYRAVEKAERILATRPEYKFFLRGSELVRVVEETRTFKDSDVFSRPRGNVYLAGLNPNDVEFVLSKAGVVFQESELGTVLPAEPKGAWCTQVISRIASFPEQVPWRRLSMVTTTPLLLKDGSAVAEPGYHEPTGVWFDPNGRQFPALPAFPTRSAAQKALKKFDRVFGKFPFAKTDDKAAVLATILGVLLRHLLPTVPLLGITAPEAGSGKTKVAEAIAATTTGCLPSRISYDDTAEFDKHLPVPLMAGDRIILIDNVDKKMVRSARLSMVLSTEAACRFRILGETKEQTILNRSVVIATGNQLAIAGDLPRRSLLAKLLPNVAQPETRNFDFDPVTRAREMFAELVIAALTAARYYLQAGCPQPVYKGVALESGSFEEWNRVVRGMLVHLGVGDPLATQEEVRAENPMLQEDVELVLALYQMFPAEQVFRVAEIKNQIAHPAHTMLVNREGRWDPSFAGRRIRELRERILQCVTKKGKTEETFKLKLENPKHMHGVSYYRVVRVGK